MLQTLLDTWILWLFFNVLGLIGLRVVYKGKTIDSKGVTIDTAESYSIYSLFFSFRGGEGFLFLGSLFTTISFFIFGLGVTKEMYELFVM